MRTELHQMMQKAISDRAASKFVKWAFAWPAQVVLAIHQVFLTHGILLFFSCNTTAAYIIDFLIFLTAQFRIGESLETFFA